MGGHCPKGCITDPMNLKMKKTNWGYRRMKATFEGGQGSEGAHSVTHVQTESFS